MTQLREFWLMRTQLVSNLFSIQKQNTSDHPIVIATVVCLLSHLIQQMHPGYAVLKES